MTHTATYSPDDNKIRIYPACRLDPDEYARVKAAGFKWAPQQQLFVAPMWTPDREDLALELSGQNELDDDDHSLTERAAERADRFEDYHEARVRDYDQAHKAVAAIADHIPLGQPILVGHHSEKRARKDAERIRSGMDRAVKAWKTAEYWTARAAGAIRHAKYKERPDVRARRIKTIEADKRKIERNIEQQHDAIKIWRNLHEPGSLKLKKNGEPYEATFTERARWVAGNTHTAGYSTYADLDAGRITPEEAQAQILASAERYIAGPAARWLEHYDHRLTYERAMLADSGYTPPPKPKTSAELPLLNYPGQVSYRNPYHRGEIATAEAVGVTKAEYAAVNKDYKGTRVSACGTHRVRTAMLHRGTGNDRWALSIVFLTDSLQHDRPDAAAVATKAAEEAETAQTRAAEKIAALEARHAAREAAPPPDPRQAEADRLAATLRAGVQTVSAPQLFPTPPDLAARVIALADLAPGHRILEPSAGTGRLVEAIEKQTDLRPYDVEAVEVNPTLAHRLHAFSSLNGARVHCADFLLTCNGDLGTFDRIVMNPPFENGADIRHIRHALSLLKPGGCLVAICANGPRQNDQLRPLARYWEDLPSGTFDGAGVRAALIRIDAKAENPEDPCLF